MTTGQIRSFAPEDTSRVMEIWLSASEKAHDFIPMEYWRSTAPLVEKEILPRARTRVFVREGRVEGFLSLIEGDHIGALFVARKARGRGSAGPFWRTAKGGRNSSPWRCTEKTKVPWGFIKARVFPFWRSTQTKPPARGNP
jgi:putative acetyltransferase